MPKEKRLMHGLLQNWISQHKVKDRSKSMIHSSIHKYIPKVEVSVLIQLKTVE